MTLVERAIITTITGLIVYSVSKFVTRDKKKVEKTTAIGILIGFFAANKLSSLYWMLFHFTVWVVIVGCLLAFAWFVFKNYKSLPIHSPLVANVDAKESGNDIQERIDRIRKNSKIPKELKEKEIAWLRESIGG